LLEHAESRCAKPLNRLELLCHLLLIVLALGNVVRLFPDALES